MWCVLYECDFYSLYTALSGKSWFLNPDQHSKYGNGLMMLTLDNRKTWQCPGIAHVFLVWRARKLCRMWKSASERAAIMMDILRIGSISFYILSLSLSLCMCMWLFSSVLMMRVKEIARELSRWNQYLKFQQQQQHDLTAMIFRDFVCFSSAFAPRPLLRIRNEFCMVRRFHEVLSTPQHYHCNIECVTAMFALIWFIWMDVTMYPRCSTYTGPMFCHNKWGNSSERIWNLWFLI